MPSEYENHNIVRVLDCTVECSCGRRITAASLEQAKKDHLFHRGVQLSRAALPPPEEGA